MSLQIPAFGIGILVMCYMTATIGKNIQTSFWKKEGIMLFGFAFAILGLKIVARIEHGGWSGFSFFGAHFFAPLGVLIACLVLRQKKDVISDLVDLSAPSLCIGLSAHKVACFFMGCCGGRFIDLSEQISFRFPSQIVESIVAFITMFFIIRLISKGKQRGLVIYWYFIVYGIERFLLTFLRDTSHTICGLPDGQFWSVISIVLGLIFLYANHLRVVTAEEKKAATQNRRAHKAH